MLVSGQSVTGFYSQALPLQPLMNQPLRCAVQRAPEDQKKVKRIPRENKEMRLLPWGSGLRD